MIALRVACALWSAGPESSHAGSSCTGPDQPVLMEIGKLDSRINGSNYGKRQTLLR